jgi:hypothetical protein
LIKGELFSFVVNGSECCLTIGGEKSNDRPSDLENQRDLRDSCVIIHESIRPCSRSPISISESNCGRRSGTPQLYRVSHANVASRSLIRIKEN